MNKSSVSTTTTNIEELKERHFLIGLCIRMAREKPLGTIGGIIVLALFFTGIFSEFLAPHGMNQVHPGASLLPPSSEYVLGTDNLGRDLFSRIIFGARISLIVGLIGSILAVLISTFIGIISGYFGGKLDLLAQRFVDGWMCFPGVVVGMVVVSLIGPGMWHVIGVVGLIYGISQSRVVRSAVISVRQNAYVEAAFVMGASNTRIILRHILPNVLAPIIILFTTRLPAVMMLEATLSFLGLGVPPPAPSWGGMLSGAARRYMLLAPWLAIWPGLALGIVVYGANMFGDAVRDLLDPRLKGGVGRYSKAIRIRNEKNSEKGYLKAN